MSRDIKPIADAIETWRTRYETCDAAGLKALWDQQHTPVTYLPTEAEAALREWQQISDYYDHICGTLNVSEWRVWDLVIDVTSDTTAFAVGRTGFTYRSKAAASGEAYWEGRISFQLHQTVDGWKIIHYEDSTLMNWAAPLVTRLQAPQLEKVEAAVQRGDTDAALEGLRALGQPVSFGTLFALAEAPWRETAPLAATRQV